MKEVPSQDPNREEKFAHRYIIGNLQHTKTDYCQHSYASNALTVQRIPPATLQQQKQQPTTRVYEMRAKQSCQTTRGRRLQQQ
jgi:hypothetical protein